MSWANDSIFYHIYPLGFCGAPAQNDRRSEPVSRLEDVVAWIDHMKSLGVNALYLGPVFESTSHGYDTIDFFQVDRRLGCAATLASLVKALHANGIRVILDAVFNHVGRDFWAFRDLLEHGEQSAYRDWFAGLRFGVSNPQGDPFLYEGWNGHFNLVKLNLRNPETRRHLLDAAQRWISEYDIDCLRLDAADCIDLEFLRELKTVCRISRPDFWLMGEVIQGDYRKWANDATLDSVTNYEVYKGLYSSHVDKNYFEIAYSLHRQFGPQGLYRHLPLYNFVDNHDVSRVASLLRESRHLFPLYCLLFTIPGVPSVYYGSEWGLQAKKTRGSDANLRPAMDLAAWSSANPQPHLADTIARLAAIRRDSTALRNGDYLQLEVRHEQLAFLRRSPQETMLVIVNASTKPAALELKLPEDVSGRIVDLLNPSDEFHVRRGKVVVDPVWPCWARIFKVDALAH
jgi:cyclomaltodextrinase / maltogenic alpha-amylase / neopullulanase